MDITPLPLCPICASATAKFIEIDGRSMSICVQCRHVFWRQMPTEAELGQYYAGSYANTHDQKAIQTDNRAYYRQHATELLQTAGLQRDVVLLDYGCAWPVMLEEAKSIPGYSRLIGVDFDQSAREHGRSVGLDMLSPENLVEQLGERSVDVLRFSHVVEHMRDPVSILRELSQLLRDGGMVYITQPIFPALALDASPASLKDAVYPEHLHFFTAASLQAAVAAMGVDIFEIAAFQKEDDVAAAFDGCIDRVHAAEINKPLTGLTPAIFGRLGGYPDFIGENVYLYGRKRAPSASAARPAASSIVDTMTRFLGRRTR